MRDCQSPAALVWPPRGRPPRPAIPLAPDGGCMFDVGMIRQSAGVAIIHAAGDADTRGGFSGGGGVAAGPSTADRARPQR